MLSKIYECEGGFDLPAKNTPLTREIRRQAAVWLRHAKSLVETNLAKDIAKVGSTAHSLHKQSAKAIASFLVPNLNDVPRLLQSFDVMHRIAYAAPCHSYLRDARLRAVDRLIKGDASLAKTDVALLLLAEADHDMRSLDDRYAVYAVNAIASWIGELKKSGGFAGLPQDQVYRRLAYILNANLTAYMPKAEENRAKAAWTESHILAEGQIDALDTATLWAYADFIDAIPAATSLERERLRSALSKIASRPDTHPLAAQALSLVRRSLQLIA